MLIDAAEKLGWPKAVDYVETSVEDRSAFEAVFANSLKLQQMYACFNYLRPSNAEYMRRGKEIRVSKGGERLSEKEGLYPIQALVHPIALRFKYHFDSARQTNRLDKVCTSIEPVWVVY